MNTVSILLPFKQYSRKLSTKYDPSLHTASNPKLQGLPDLYPKLRDAEFVEQALKKRKS